MAVIGFPKTLAWWNFGKPVDQVPASYNGSHTDCHIAMDIAAAYTTTSAGTGSGAGYKLANVQVTLKLLANDTWVKKGVPQQSNAAAILKHEQGHFNIAGIAAKDLERELKALRNASMNDLLSEANDLVSAWIASGQTEEETYDGSVADGGTDHGNDVTAQASWNSKIAAAKSLNDLP